jgi:LysR family transcriptional regulator, hydrogen peroxide-inducible genes activator
MEMHQVRYFLAVAETLNFTRAAERCNVTQPALTRAIKNLEDELSGPLFRRERANTHLTELGRTMLPYIAEVHAQSETAKTRAKQFAKLDRTPLSVGIMCTLGPQKLMTFMRGFRDANPGVDISLRDAKGQILQEMLAAGELDVAIYGLPGGIDDVQLHAMKLFDERFMIGFPEGHRFDAQREVALKDMQGERYLFRSNCEYGDHIRELYRANGVEILRPYRSERDDWIQSMVVAGLGVMTVPEYAVTVAGLRTRRLRDPDVTRTIHLVTVRGRPHSTAVGAFLRAAVGHDWKV